MANFLIIAIVMAVFFISASLSVKGEILTVTVINPSNPECSDGLDNDSDGLTDYPNDPGCSSALDNDEIDPFCGDGACNGSETCSSCPADCGTCPVFCGDGICNGSETCSSCPADCGTCPPSGGGGGGISYTPVTRVIFSGRAYPSSDVTLLKDAQISASTIAGADTNFQIDLSGLSAGNYIFSIYSEDKTGRRSSLLTFPISVTQGATTNVSGIFIAPTIAVDKSEVKRGDNIAIFGQSVPQVDIIISVNSEEEFFAKTISDNDGIYLYNFDTILLDYGSHLAKSKASIGNQLVSGFSYLVNFKVGAKTVLKDTIKCGKADLNCNGRVNLIDFSIAAYWYKKSSPPDKVDLNSDGKVDLVDFSIMAYYWTG